MTYCLHLQWDPFVPAIRVRISDNVCLRPTIRLFLVFARYRILVELALMVWNLNFKSEFSICNEQFQRFYKINCATTTNFYSEQRLYCQSVFEFRKVRSNTWRRLLLRLCAGLQQYYLHDRSDLKPFCYLLRTCVMFCKISISLHCFIALLDKKCNIWAY